MVVTFEAERTSCGMQTTGGVRFESDSAPAGERVGGSQVAERYRVEWTYEGSSMASYDTYDLVGAERYMSRVMEDPIAEDVRIVEAEPE